MAPWSRRNHSDSPCWSTALPQPRQGSGGTATAREEGLPQPRETEVLGEKEEEEEEELEMKKEKGEQEEQEEEKKREGGGRRGAMGDGEGREG